MGNNESIENNFDEPEIKGVSSFLGKICDDDYDNYHCKTLRKILWCSANKPSQADEQVDSNSAYAYCKKQSFSAYWHINYHVEQLLHEKKIKKKRNQSVDTRTVTEMQNFVKAYDEIAENGYDLYIERKTNGVCETQKAKENVKENDENIEYPTTNEYKYEYETDEYDEK